MRVCIRPYAEEDLSAKCRMRNQIVEEGNDMKR